MEPPNHQRRPASRPGSGSVSDLRKAAYVGGSRERARPATRGALIPPPHAFRRPRTPHEHAHPLAHAARDPRCGHLPACRPFGRHVISRHAPAARGKSLHVAVRVSSGPAVVLGTLGGFQTSRDGSGRAKSAPSHRCRAWNPGRVPNLPRREWPGQARPSHAAASPLA